MADDLERRAATGEIGKAADADEPHRHTDRHTQQHQREQRDEARYRYAVSAHAAKLIRPA